MHAYTTVMNLRTGKTHISLMAPARAVSYFGGDNPLEFTDRGFVLCGEYIARNIPLDNPNQLTFPEMH